MNQISPLRQLGQIKGGRDLVALLFWRMIRNSLL